MYDRTEVGSRGYLTQEFRLFHLRDQRQLQLDYHYHTFDKIVVHLSGQVTYLVEGSVCRLQPWDILLVGRGEIHRPVIDPAQPFSAAAYQKMAKEAIEDVFARGKFPIVSGGTGLYLNSLLYEMDFGQAERDTRRRQELAAEAALYGPQKLYARLTDLDPGAAARIHPHNVQRVIRALEAAESGGGVGDFSKCKAKSKDYDVNLIILTRNRAQLYDRINKRVDLLVEKGLFEEVRSLLDMGLTEDDISMKGIGYKEIISFFRGNIGKDDAVDLIKKNTRHFAKRQLTWFRRYDQARWLDISEYKDEDTAFEVMMQWLQRK